jgi:hypothetical protein
MNRLNKITIALLLSLILMACEDKPIYQTQGYTKEEIAATKLCPEIKYKCLTQTQDPKWRETLLATKIAFTKYELFWNKFNALEKLFDFYEIDEFSNMRFNIITMDANGKLKNTPTEKKYQARIDIALKKTAELLNKTKEQIMSDKVYIMGKEELATIRRQNKRRMYLEISKMLDLFYPDFWGDTPVEEQIKWIMQVELKKEQFPKFGNSQGALEVMTHICAIVGIDFDTKPEHKHLYDFLTGEFDFSTDALDYLYFVYLERDYGRGGLHFNDWSMRDALGHMPQPQRHVPSFPDEMPDGKAQNFDYSIQRIYKDTIRKGGRKHDPKNNEVVRAYMKTLKPVSIKHKQNKE